MVFQSPFWLTALLPWIALAVYLLPGRGQPRLVSTLLLWRGERSYLPLRSARLWSISTLFLLLSLLLAVLAAGRPALRSASVSDRNITILLDRGASMALPSGSHRAFRGTIEKCATQIGSVGADVNVSLVAVPGEKIETVGNRWIDIANAMSPTIVHTQISQTVVKILHENNDRLFVLSDQPVNVEDDRVVQIFPERPENCVAITKIGARATPHPQVYLHLENHSSPGKARLRIISGTGVVERDEVLGKMATDLFVDLPGLQQTVNVRIESEPVENPWANAWLIRTNPGVRILGAGKLSAGVQKLMDVYSADRPATDESRSVWISNRPLAVDQSGIWIEAAEGDGKPLEALSVGSHALTQNIKTWPAPGGSILPPEGFRPVVSASGVVIVAVRESPTRQIWINGDLESWRQSADFVIFFSNAFRWLGGDSVYTAMAGGELDKPWPGVYGTTAINAGDFPEVKNDMHRTSVQSTMRIGAGASLSPGLLITALVFLAMSGLMRDPVAAKSH